LDLPKTGSQTLRASSKSLTAMQMWSTLFTFIFPPPEKRLTGFPVYRLAGAFALGLNENPSERLVGFHPWINLSVQTRLL